MNIDGKVIEACCGNAEAASFVRLWLRYIHLIDDVVDGDKAAINAIGIGQIANELYSHPFYLKYVSALHMTVQILTCAYEDSVEMAKGNAWQKSESDHLRHSGLDLVRAVAFICGGYAHMKALSLDMRSIAWHSHHNENGEAV